MQKAKEITLGNIVTKLYYYFIFRARYSEFTKFCLPKSLSFRKIYEGRTEEPVRISKKTINLIKNLLFKTLEGENRWRKLIKKLKELFPDFFQESFALLDARQKNFIVIDDLKNFLNSWELFPTAQETEMLFLRLDLYNEGIISYKDYIKNLSK